MAKPKILIVVGPTASGKSSLGVKLAKLFNGEVISADSRQIYKGLNIGTGKITKKEMSGIPHHMLDVANLKTKYSVSKYKKQADKILLSIISKDKIPIVVGGTGFYIDTISNRLILPEVEPNAIFRKKFEKLSTEKLYKILKKKNPEKALTIDKHNKIRLIRALEIIGSLGYVPNLKTNPKDKNNFIFVGLNPEKAVLEKQIKTRLKKWIDAGLVNEVKRLRSKNVSWKRLNELGLVYRTVVKYLQKKINKNEMMEEINKDIKHYAKRQMTWFKRNKTIKWFKPEEHKKIEKYVIKNLSGLYRT